MSSRGGLASRKVLVVEDSYLIADHVCAVLAGEGCEVLGPTGRLATALELFERGPLPDCAVLDVNLNGEYCFPLARALAEQGVPFVLLTGYDDTRIVPPDLSPAAVLGKPIVDAALVDVVTSACEANSRDQ